VLPTKITVLLKDKKRYYRFCLIFVKHTAVFCYTIYLSIILFMKEYDITRREFAFGTSALSTDLFISKPLRGREKLAPKEKEPQIEKYSKENWRCIGGMADIPSGLPVDKAREQKSSNGSSVLVLDDVMTSPTNIGLYLTGCIGARNLGIIEPPESTMRIQKALMSLQNLPKYKGLYSNWYNAYNGEVMSGGHLISTVDNAWLVGGLSVISSADQENKELADSLLNDMEFSILYNKDRGLFYGGFDPRAEHPTYGWHYDTLVSESRMASYMGVEKFGIPTENYEQLGTFTEQEIRKLTSENDLNPELINFPKRLTLSWGGSMFEGLMPTLFVPEYHQSKNWQEIHDRTIREQIAYGRRNNNGFWGYSPCQAPDGDRYSEVGLPNLSMRAEGYGASSVVTPHAVFLAAPFVPNEAMNTLKRLEETYPDLHSPEFGFRDSVDIATSAVCPRYLALDQAMSFLAGVNMQTDNIIHKYSGLEESANSFFQKAA
jgi:hypothetical protein